MRTGHTHRITKRREDHLRLLRDRQRVVDASERNHANRTTRSMNHFDVCRQQILDTVLEDRVRVSAADFHKLQPAIAQRRDLFRQSLRQISLPELVDEFHWMSSLFSNEGCWRNSCVRSHTM